MQVHGKDGETGTTAALSHQHGLAPPAHSLGHDNKEVGFFFFVLLKNSLIPQQRAHTDLIGAPVI